MNKIYTPDNFEIIYISDWFFNTLEKEMTKIMRTTGDPNDMRPMIALRDEPAKIEFRRLSNIFDDIADDLAEDLTEYTTKSINKLIEI